MVCVLSIMIIISIIIIIRTPVCASPRFARALGPKYIYGHTQSIGRNVNKLTTNKPEDYCVKFELRAGNPCVLN